MHASTIPRTTPRGLLWIAILAAGVAGPSGAKMLAVAVDEAGGGASIALVGVVDPWPVRTRTVAIGRDSILQTRGRRIYALSRAENALYVVDPRRGETEAVVDLGHGGRAEDVAVVKRRRVYVSRRDETHLLRVDPTTGETVEAVDLGPLADADGIPDMGRMIRHKKHLFVQLKRRNPDFPFSFEAPAMLAVVDLRRETLIDVDPDRPGIQAIELVGTPPRFRMQVDRKRKRLYVSATGGFFDPGGIEEIDLANLRSTGLIVAEEDGESGADTGAFVLTSPSSGFLIFSTDLLLSSHLVKFVPGEGVVTGELHLSLETFIPALQHDRKRGQLFLIDENARPPGVFVFEVEGGRRLNPAPIPTGGAPTDALLVRGRVGG